MQDKAEDAVEWMAHVQEQVRAEAVFARVVGQNCLTRQESHVIISNVPNAGQKWSEDKMKILIIFNHQPYDNTDVTWNGLRLAGKLLEAEQEVKIFLMNDSVDMAREVCKPPEGYDQDLSQMLKDLIAKGVSVKVCGTCMARCGIHKNQPYFEGAQKATMPELAEWVVDCEKILTF